MFRTFYFTVLTLGLLCLSAFRVGDPFFERNPFIYNTTVAHLFHSETRSMPFAAEEAEGDISLQARVLMLDYSAYGGAYNEKIRGMIQQYLPGTIFTDFNEGAADDLTKALSSCDVALVAYPSASATGAIRTYTKVLQQFVQQGGTVIFTGTHEFEVLQQFDLFELDFGYFSKERPIHSLHPEHPVFQGVNSEVTLSNFAYPLDISDPGFVTLAEVAGYPVIGYKPSGLGKVIYIGVEYYFDESASTQILINAIQWLMREKNVDGGFGISVADPSRAGVKRSEETLYAGSGKAEQVELKIYPNPYFSKATLDVELTKATPVMVEMTDEVGRNVALILPKKTVGPGLCRFELPNITPGIYFLQVQLGDKTYVRKVVKSASN
jgi:Secretion system C-terminal sorting domain